MKALIIVSVLAVLAGSAVAAVAEPIGYAPILLLYAGGKFVGVKTFAPPTATKAECLEEAQREVLKILEGAPQGATAIGGCLPIPAVEGSTPITKPHPKADGTTTI